jgi:hypothetical protein
MLSIHYCWLDHTGDTEWLPKFYPNINEDENHFKNEQEAINWLIKQKELDKDFGSWQHFKLEKIYLV